MHDWRPMLSALVQFIDKDGNTIQHFRTETGASINNIGEVRAT